MRKQGKKRSLYSALTIMEMVLSMAIMAVIFAVLLPQVKALQNSWDSRAGTAETLQHGRVLIDHLNRNLSKAVSITDVSDSSETNGYIEFEDNEATTLRYDISATNFVEFGEAGSLDDIAGPVSQFLFTCYDGNDMDTPTTDGNDIRLVNVQATLTNPSTQGRDLTVETSVFLRTGGPAAEAADPNLLLWLKFDETSGSTAADSSNYGNDGTLTNMHATNDWVEGRIGNALDFDGHNDYVDVSSLSAPTDKTFACWIYINDLTDTYHTLMEFGDDAPWFGLAQWYGDWYLLEWDKGCWSNASLSTGQWYHIAYTSDSATNRSRIYLNGVEDTYFAPGASTETGSGMGVAYHSGDDPFEGVIDDVRVYDYALSATEISALYYLAGPAYQEFTEARLGSDGTSLTISTPSGASEDSLLIAAVATDGDTASSLDPPSGEGWTQVFLNDQAAQVTIGVWWKLADASESASHEFTWSGSEQAYGWMMRFEGHDPSDPIHVYAADGDTDSNPSSPPVTTTLDKCLILRLGAFDDDDITVDSPGLSGHTAITMDSSQSPAVSYEEFTEAKAGYDTTSLTINKPAGTVEGDLLIAAVATDGNTKYSLAAPGGQGWTQIVVDDEADKVTLGVWWKLAGASEAGSHQFTWSGGQEAYGWIMRFTGHNPSSPIGDWDKHDSASVFPVCDSVTTTVANCMILRIGAFDDDDVVTDVTGLEAFGHATITMDQSSGGNGTCSGGAGYQQQGTVGASSEPWFTLSGYEQYVTLSVVIAPAPGGSGGVSGGAGYVTQASAGSSGTSAFSLTASEQARTVTIAIAPPAQ
jgi:hypothetical protein